MIDITIEGFPQLKAKLAEIEEKVERKIVVKALRDESKRLLPIVQSRINIGPKAPHLRSLMKVRALKRSRQRFGIQIVTPPREKLGISPDDTSYYPATLEYGSARKGIPAYPYMRNTIDENRSTSLSNIGSAIGKALEEIPKAKT